MSRRKVAPWLLAASVFLSGATGVMLLGAFTPAHAITSVEELRDVDSSSWAYQALADLVEKYDVIEGYPDYTFRGNHKATRYELAAALNAVIKAVGRDLARLGAEKANKADLATLAKLQDEFRNELAALNARTGALESRAAAIEAKNAQQDTRLDLLEKTQLHGDFSIGILSDFSGSGNRVTGTGDDGLLDGISTLGRFRLGVKVPVVAGYDNTPVGEGDVIARLVGAFGRWAPQGAPTGVTDPYPISGYSAIAGDASANNEGVQASSLQLGTLATGLNTRQNYYVESAYYKQHYKPGVAFLTDIPGVSLFPDTDNFRTTADVYVGILPWRNLFDRSPYRGDELNQFQNTALVNNAGLLVDTVDPTLAVAWHQGLGNHLAADVTGAVSTFDNSDFFNGFHVTEELAVNYDTSFLGASCTKPGTIFAGGYHIFFQGNNNLQTLALAASPTGTLLNRDGENVLFTASGSRSGNETLNSFYTGWNQEWWRGIGTSVDWVLNSGGPNNALLNSLRNGTGANVAFNNTGRIVGIGNSLSAVLSVPLTVFNKDLTRRAKDVWGFGYSWITPSPNGDAGDDAPLVINRGNTINNANEHVFETYYRWVVNNNVTVVPSLQVIINRDGVSENGADWVLGLRTNYVF